MPGRTLAGFIALTLVMALALTLTAPRPAVASDDWVKILAGAAVGYLVYDALDRADRDCPPRRYGYGYGYSYGYGYCPPPPPPPPPPRYKPHRPAPRPPHHYGGSWYIGGSWGASSGPHGGPTCRGGGW
jgi:hypothetical protein